MLLTLPALALLGASPLTPVKYPGLDQLVDRIGTRFEQQVESSMNDLHTVRVHKEELDGDGHVKEVDEQVLESKGQGDARTFALVSATQDGKDVTAERRAKHDAYAREHPRHPEEHDHGGEVKLTEINPFAASVRKQYLYWVVAPLPAPGAPVHLHFKPWEPRKDRFVGDALVDPTTGAIRELTVTPSDLPMLVDRLNIHAVFGQAAQQDRAGDVEIDAGGGFLFWHKHFKVHMTLAYVSPDKT